MIDRKKILKQLAGIGIALDMDGHHADAQCVRDAITMLKDQEQTIEALKEKLRLLEYGNHDCVQDVLMPAT